MEIKPTARQITFQALMRVETDSSYSNLTLDKELSESQLDGRDKRFVTGLFYGVIEKKLLLDYNLAVLSEKPLGALDQAVRVLLRMGLYQLFFMNSIPASAAVNETVKLCKGNHLSHATGFVNGVLRAASKLSEPKLPDPKKGKNKYYAIRYSCPEKVIRLWRESYGDDLTLGILSTLDGRPPLCVRVNTLKTTGDELTVSLQHDGVTVQRHPLIGDCLLLSDTGAVEQLSAFRKGWFHVQDAASQLCCQLLAPQAQECILDVCAAPGGKSFTCAERMENSGQLLSGDLYEARLRLVRNGAARLGITILQTVVCDAAEYDFGIMADRVLCDVPCSGLGIIRRKPELRYKPDLGLQALPETQYRILCHASRYVRPGGMLVYSTCTLNPAENGDNVRRFLTEHPDFAPQPLRLPDGLQRGIPEPDNELTLFPHLNRTDGFFICGLRKRKE